MELTKERAEEYYRNLEFTRRKIQQAVEIKAKLDKKRNAYVNLLIANPTLQNVNNLLGVYRKEFGFLDIIKKGARNLEEFNEELEETLESTGIISHTWNIFRRRKTNTSYKSVLITRQIKKFVNGYLTRINKEFERVEGHFVQQMRVLITLESIIRNNQDTQLVLNHFVSEYNTEIKTVQAFQKKENDRLLRTIRNAGAKEVAIYVGMQALPAPMTGTAALPYFGVEYAALISLLAITLKYMMIAGYTYHIGRE